MVSCSLFSPAKLNLSFGRCKEIVKKYFSCLAELKGKRRGKQTKGRSKRKVIAKGVGYKR